MNNLTLSNSEIELLLDNLSIKWSTQLNPEIVSNVIEVAKSSFLFWRTHLDNIYIDGSGLRNTFHITSIRDNDGGNKRDKDEIYHFKLFSPKLDSTNSFIS